MTPVHRPSPTLTRARSCAGLNRMGRMIAEAAWPWPPRRQLWRPRRPYDQDVYGS